MKRNEIVITNLLNKIGDCKPEEHRFKDPYIKLIQTFTKEEWYEILIDLALEVSERSIRERRTSTYFFRGAKLENQLLELTKLFKYLLPHPKSLFISAANELLVDLVCDAKDAKYISGLVSGLSFYGYHIFNPEVLCNIVSSKTMDYNARMYCAHSAAEDFASSIPSVFWKTFDFTDAPDFFYYYLLSLIREEEFSEALFQLTQIPEQKDIDVVMVNLSGVIKDLLNEFSLHPKVLAGYFEKFPKWLKEKIIEFQILVEPCISAERKLSPRMTRYLLKSLEN